MAPRRINTSSRGGLFCQEFSSKKSLSKTKKDVVKITDLPYLKTMKNELNNNERENNVLDFVRKNEGLNFKSGNEFYRFCYDNCKDVMLVSEKVLGQEFNNAYLMGYAEEAWQNPFQFGSFNYWLAQECYGQGASDV